MKSITCKTVMMLSFLVLFIAATNGQRRNRNQAPVKNTPVQLIDPHLLNGLPVIIDSSGAKGISAQSPKPIGASSNMRLPLPYENLRWDDALYAQKVWRELDFREKINQPFRAEPGGNEADRFINILLEAVTSGMVKAFRDDRFSDSLSINQLVEMSSGKWDTSMWIDPTTLLPNAYIVTRAGFDVQLVNKLLIMEEWVFDSKTSRMHCRILGIAPLKSRYLPGGKQPEASSIMFWVSYGDLRPLLANSIVYNPKNQAQAGRMTWEELFESRMFSSYIVKSTMDNPSNLSIRSRIKNPVLALQEGENIQEKIFKYEQDLWSY